MTTSLLQRISFPVRNFNGDIPFDGENCQHLGCDMVFDRLGLLEHPSYRSSRNPILVSIDFAIRSGENVKCKIPESHCKPQPLKLAIPGLTGRPLLPRYEEVARGFEHYLRLQQHYGTRLPYYNENSEYLLDPISVLLMPS